MAVVAKGARTQAQAKAAAGRRIKQRAANPERGFRDVTAQATANGEFFDESAPNVGGQVEGSIFEWDAGLFFDPLTGAYYDRGQYEARDYAEMLRVYHKGRALEAVLTLPLRSAGWKLTPAKGDTGEAEQTEEQLRRPPDAGGMTTPISQVLGQMTSAMSFRRSFHAKGFKLDPRAGDGTVMYSQLAYRPASTCRMLLDPASGAFRGFEQDLTWYADSMMFKKHGGLPVQFKPAKSLVYVHGAHRDPVGGVSDLEIVYWCWKTQQKLLRLWFSYLEGVALPRTIVKHKGDEGKARQAANQIAKMRSSGVAWIDMSQMDLDTLDLSGKGPMGFVDAIRYLDTAASGSILASFTDLGAAAAGGHGPSRGSFALSKDQTDFYLQGREAVAGEWAGCLTSDLVAPLIRYNYGPDGKCPTWTFDPLAGIDEQPIMTLLQALATAAQTSLPPEFVGQIIVEAARFLSLDVDKVRSAVETSQKLAEKAAKQAGASPLGQQVAGVAGAVTKVAEITRGRQIKAAKAAKGKPGKGKGRKAA